MLKLVYAPNRRSLLAALTAPLLLAGCGLGMDNADRLERAQAAFEAGEYRAAIIDSRNVLREEPKNREARLLLGRSSLEVHDAAAAEKELRRAVDLGADPATVAVDLGRAMLALRQNEKLLDEITPEAGGSEADRFAILRLRGDAMLALGRPEDARAVYRQVLASTADDLPSLIGVASTYTAEADYENARRTIDEALAIDAENVPVLIASASLLMSTREHDAAVESFAKAADLAAAGPDDSQEIAALSGLVEAELARQDLAAAKAALERLNKTAPDNLSTIFLTARVAAVEENYELAQTELQRVLAVAPQSRPAQLLMGAVQLQRGNLGQAEMHLSSVVAAAPDDSEARKLLAEIRLRQDRADEAAEILRPVLQAEDADVGALNLAVRASLAAGEVDTAIGQLRQALDRDPDNTDIRLDLAAAYLAAGDPDQADALLKESAGSGQNAYRQALLKVMTPLRRGDAKTALGEARNMAERWPEDARARNLVGGIAQSLDDTELARKSFLEAIERNPADVAAYLNLARLDLREGDFDAARTRYLAALEQRPGSVQVMIALAQLEARAERIGAAVDWLEKARAADDTALAPRLLLAGHYLEARDFEAAESAAAEAVALADHNADAHNLFGLARQARGETKAALESFRAAARLDPDQPDYRMNQARAEAALGETDHAERTLLGAGELDLDDLRTAVMIAALKAQEGDAAAAMKIARDLQSRHPDHAVPYALEAELLAADEHYEQAAAVYDKALSLRSGDRRLAVRAFSVRRAGGLDAAEKPLLNYLDERPLDADARVLVAQSYQTRGDSERAIAQYETVLDTAPDNFVALNNLAWEYFVTGDSRAEKTAQAAFERSPENGSVADTLGWIQIRNGNLEKGIVNLRSAAKLSDDNPDVQYHLAAGLAAAGKSDEARRLLEAVLAADDEFAAREDAEDLLRNL